MAEFVFENVDDKKERIFLNDIDQLRLSLYIEKNKVYELNKALNVANIELKKIQMEKNEINEKSHKKDMKSYVAYLTDYYEIGTDDWSFNPETGEITKNENI